MPRPIKSITDPRLKLEILSPEDVRRIHEATLEVIETVGVRFPSPKALEVWEAHGAQVDRNTMIVRAPGHLIEDALKKAPPVYTLAARDPTQDLPLDGNHVYVGTDGCGVQVIDLYTGERRRSTLKDVAEIARVADYVEEVAFIWIPVSAQDRPPETRGLYELKAAWENTTNTSRRRASIRSGRRGRRWKWRPSSRAGGRNCVGVLSSPTLSVPRRLWARTPAPWRQRWWPPRPASPSAL